MRFRFAGFVAVVLASSTVMLSFSACSSSGPRPDAGSIDQSSSSGGSSSGSTPTDAAGDAEPDTGIDSGTCANSAKDGSETDVDCGGQCSQCQVGKVCLKKEDCQNGLECEVTEDGKTEKKCRVGSCIDTLTNGGETDLNCGGVGTGCNRCTVGKRCTADTDCRSGKCTNLSCACPTGMTIVTLAAGGAYCVDTAEVTKGQYQKFIEANVPKTSQDAMCSTNTDWIPAGAWPPAADKPGANPLVYNNGLPVHYVDWCDAVGYCKWAKKELCGKIGGGHIAQTSANDATQDAWYNACSAQGTKAFSYDTAFTAGKCVDGSGAGTQTEPGIVENSDLGLYRVANIDNNGQPTGYVNQGCQGGYVGLYQMIGNAGEWENSCDDETSAGANCKIRGGSYAAAGDSTQLRCDSDREAGRLTNAADVGFRCCLY